MTKTYIISDMHFGHKNIMLYESRPFKDIDDMNDNIIKNWNNTVNREDKVFCLGDVAFGSATFTKDIVKKLNGKKYLIYGNHDRSKSPKFWIDAGFENVSKYPIIYKNFWMLSHEPLYLNEFMPYVNIHGHTHSTKFESKKFYNVSVECINYTPINFEDIKKFYEEVGKK